MGLRLQRVWLEVLSCWEACEDWWQEIVVENAPRYRQPDQWVHLWIDLFGATQQLLGRVIDRTHYTGAHILGVGLPVWGLWELYHAFTNLLDKML